MACEPFEFAATSFGIRGLLVLLQLLAQRFQVPPQLFELALGLLKSLHAAVQFLFAAIGQRVQQFGQIVLDVALGIDRLTHLVGFDLPAAFPHLSADRSLPS